MFVLQSLFFHWTHWYCDSQIYDCLQRKTGYKCCTRFYWVYI